MKTWTIRIAVATWLLATVTSALANISDPHAGRRKAPATSAFPARMRIEPNEEATEAKLVIPRDIWLQLKAEVDGDDSQPVAASTGLSSLSGVQTVMAGLFLSLAFAFGGLWLVRSRKETGKLARAALGVAVLAACAAAASVAYANAGPPPVARSLTSKILIPQAQWYGASGTVRVSLADEGSSITLVLPKPKEQPR